MTEDRERMDLLDQLRNATSEVHGRLEADLDLLERPLERDRFLRVLERFWGFHAAWEPSLGAHAALEDFVRPRRRLALLGTDLEALGRTPAQISALPCCFGAVQLTSTLERAWGSLYVMEGSTLGGRVITKALRQADWVPAAGLTYFDPYGSATGARWRELQDRLTRAATPETQPQIVAGAAETFALLHRWLLEGLVADRFVSVETRVQTSM